eukprot:1378205-Ditylum_brightwellii.AAC.1
MAPRTQGSAASAKPQQSTLPPCIINESGAQCWWGRWWGDMGKAMAQKKVSAWDPTKCANVCPLKPMQWLQR